MEQSCKIQHSADITHLTLPKRGHLRIGASPFHIFVGIVAGADGAGSLAAVLFTVIVPSLMETVYCPPRSPEISKHGLVSGLPFRAEAFFEGKDDVSAALGFSMLLFA